MRTFLIVFLIFLINCISIAQQLPDKLGTVNDYENVFSEKEERILTKLIIKQSKIKGDKISLISIEKFNPSENLDDY